jgi:hypothetical protein
MIHRKYDDFLNENNTDNMEDVIAILDLMKDLPTKEILGFRDSLDEVIDKNESLNENVIGDFLFKMKDKFRRAVYNQIWKYMINQKKAFYMEVKDKLNIFDISNLDDIKKNLPNFKLNGLYLAGGMDKAVDVGAGWRHVVENIFETYKTKSSDLPVISLGKFGHVSPCRVVDGEYLDMYLENTKKTEKLYTCRPLTLNPVRKEVDRTKDKDFADAMKNYKTFNQDTPVEDYEPTISNIRTTLTRTIEVDDEHLVRIADATLLGLNSVAGSGTFGETETISYMNKPIFVWMTDDGWSLKDFSVWTFPHFMRIARNPEEMTIMVTAIIDYAEKNK